MADAQIDISKPVVLNGDNDANTNSNENETDDETLLIQTPRGTRDLHPIQMRFRKKITDLAESVFQKHGAQSISTPVFELNNILINKYGDQQKLVYELSDQGGSACSLRYDLTVPLARYVAQHNISNLKRYQIANVYRRDNPSIKQGRLREFTQMDYDVVGYSDLMMADAETIKVVSEIIDGFGSLLKNKIDPVESTNSSKPIVPILEKNKFKYTIYYNHKVLLDLLLIDMCGVPLDKIRTACSSIDNLDKRPWSQIKTELLNKGLTNDVIDKIEGVIQISGEPLETLAKLRLIYKSYTKIQNVLDEINLCFEYLKMFDCLDKITFSLRLVRGLDYYTASIFECVVLSQSEGMAIGSVAGGGRYDNLIGMFANRQISAVGCSVGFERLLAILEQENNTNITNLQSTTQVVVTFLGKKNIPVLQKNMMTIVNMLWDAGLNVEFNTDSKMIMKDQIANTLKAGVPFMILFGELELQKNIVQVKDLAKNTRSDVMINDIVAYMKSVIANHNLE
jgi:histidyl-tRNA synthetase